MFSIFKIFKKKKVVPHIRLSGVIGSVGKFKQGLNFAGQQELIEKAFSIKKAKAIAISVNSPGGSPVQSHLIYSYIKKQAKKNKKKVLVFAEDVAASGGYLIACAGDEIYANSSSIIGSIGVIYSSFGLQELIKKAGIQRRIYTAGKNKSTLDPFVEEKEEDIQRLKKIQLDLHANFIKVVEASRSTKLKKDKNPDLFTGEFWSGSKAKELGLIDGIGNVDEILVSVDVTHSWIGDLVIQVSDPNGTEFTNVWARSCNDAQYGNIDVTFDDNANPINCATPTQGTYAPAAPLSVFNGLDQLGDWQRRMNRIKLLRAKQSLRWIRCY